MLKSRSLLHSYPLPFAAAAADLLFVGLFFTF